MHPGKATAEGTARLASRFPAHRAAGFYRQTQDLWISNIGLGTYLGQTNEETDRAYANAVTHAVRLGANVIDSAINYRHQRSELSVGQALATMIETGAAARDELVVCTKAGFLVPGAVPAGVLADSDVAGGMHSMAPAFLSDQLERSRANLGLETIDVFYLHNPETQLGFVPPDVFYDRMAAAFTLLEELAARGKIAFYGTATWDGYRTAAGAGGGLSLVRLVETARRAGGESHRFRFVQLPFNLAMPEAFVRRSETVNAEPLSVLEAAAYLGLTVVASASLLQARLSRGLPGELAEKFTGTVTDAQRAIQFTRSTPGISCALVGMSDERHVIENLALASLSAIQPEAYLGLYR